MKKDRKPQKPKQRKPRDEYKRTKNWGVSIKRQRTKRTRIWA